MERQKTLTFIDLVGMAFAAFMSLEVVASQASMGPSLVFCFLVIGGVYFVLHALVCSELGGAYPDQGGIYVWVKKAYGDKWAARTTWWYWVNVVGFIPSAFVVMGTVFQQLFMPDMSVWGMVGLCVAFTWLVVLLNILPLRYTKIIPNISSVCKAVACLSLVGGAVLALVTRGSATEFSAGTMLPTLDINFWALIPVYVYSLTGLDLMSCSAGEMEDPRRDVPRSVFSSGILAIVMYIITACALLILMPQEEIDESSGVIDALIRVFGDYPVLLYALGAAIVFSFLGYALSWALGGNKAAQEAGEFGELPAVFSKTNAAGSPMGAGVLLGIASTVLLVFYGFVASSNEGLFWTLFAFTSIIFFLPYIMMSFVFITLRRKDPDTPRPFRVPGPDWVGRLVALLHGILLIASAIFFFIPPEGEDPLVYILTLGGGVVAALALGEFLVSSSMKKSAAQEN